MKKLLFLQIVALCLLLTSCNDEVTKDQKTASKEEQVEKDYLVKISTKHGDMYVVLYDDTPIHKANFIKLAQNGAYDDLLFHRVIKDLLIYGGDPKSKDAPLGTQLGVGKNNYTLKAEINAKRFHKRGALSAARLKDKKNPKRSSSSSIFSIVQGTPVDSATLALVEKKLHYQEQSRAVKKYIDQPENAHYLQSMQALEKQDKHQEIDSIIDAITPAAWAATLEGPFDGFSNEARQSYTTIGGAPHLDHQYTVFGEVVKGLEVIDIIAQLETYTPTGANKPGQRPLEDVKMTVSVERLPKSIITERTGYAFN